MRSWPPALEGSTSSSERSSPGGTVARRASRHLPSEDGPGGPDEMQPEAAPRAALDLDRLIHERIRLGIVSALAVNDHLSFNDLKKLLKTTDGNLSVHARKLEEGGTSPARSTSRGGCRRPSSA